MSPIQWPPIPENFRSSVGIPLVEFGWTDGGNNSQALSDAYDALPIDGGTILLPPGTTLFEDMVLGSRVSTKGKSVNLVGVGPASQLKPIASGESLMLQGPMDSSSYNFGLANLHFGQHRLDLNVYDFDPRNPFIKVDGFVNILGEHISCYWRGTGTILALNCAYEGEIKNWKGVVSRWCVPLTFNDGITLNQEDTFKLTHFINSGNFGALFHRISQGAHTLRMDGFKQYVPAGADRERSITGYFTNDIAAGSNVIPLGAGQATGMNIGDPVFIGYGRYAEIGKITDITGDQLTLMWGLEFNHPASTVPMAGQVICGSVPLSFSSNTQLVDIQSSHFEGGAIGVMFGDTAAINIENCQNSNRVLVQLAGATEDLTIGQTWSSGGYQFAGENIICRVPAQNPSTIQRIHLKGPFRKFGTDPVVVPLDDPGGKLTNQYTRIGTIPNGSWLDSINGKSGDGANSLIERSQNGTVNRKSRVDGREVWVSGGTEVGLDSPTATVLRLTGVNSRFRPGGSDSDIFQGTGTPETSQLAGIGSIFIRTDAPSIDKALYVKTTGSGVNTGWRQLAGIAIGTAVYDPPSIAAGAVISTTVNVSGVAKGQTARAAHTQMVAGIVTFAEVTAAGVVTVYMWNTTAGAIDIASGTLRAEVTASS